MKSNGECESGYVGDAELIGTTSSTFTNIRIIRQGAMSVAACAERYGHRWMLKSLPPSDNSTLSAQRLRKEFEIATRLHHPGIVKAISLENVEGLGLSMVMEWIEGETLDKILADRKLSGKETRRLASDIVDAVAYMHSMGIVHRDLKLSNIIVRKNGMAPVIVDFGLSDTDVHTTLKQAAGTVGYMSPEAYQKHDADTRDDVYSLGIILQRLSVGMPGVVRKCIAPAEKRYANAESVRLAMQRAASMRKALKWASVAMVAAAILGAMGYEIASLHRQREDDAATVVILRDSIANISDKTIMGEQTISKLNDSLSVIHERMRDAASKRKLIDDHNAELDRVVKNGVMIAKSIFRQFDNGYVESLRLQGVGESEINNMLVTTVSESLDRYLEGARKSLSEDDFSLIYRSVWEREVQLYNDWQKNVFYGKQ